MTVICVTYRCATQVEAIVALRVEAAAKADALKAAEAEKAALQAEISELRENVAGKHAEADKCAAMLGTRRDGRAARHQRNITCRSLLTRHGFHGVARGRVLFSLLKTGSLLEKLVVVIAPCQSVGSALYTTYGSMAAPFAGAAKDSLTLSREQGRPTSGAAGPRAEGGARVTGGAPPGAGCAHHRADGRAGAGAPPGAHAARLPRAPCHAITPNTRTAPDNQHAPAETAVLHRGRCVQLPCSNACDLRC